MYPLRVESARTRSTEHSNAQQQSVTLYGTSVKKVRNAKSRQTKTNNHGTRRGRTIVHGEGQGALASYGRPGRVPELHSGPTRDSSEFPQYRSAAGSVPRSSLLLSGYDMESATWGVKWGAYEEEDPVVTSGVYEGMINATYDFTCAWGPPVRFYQEASRSWPQLMFYVSYGGEGPCLGRLMFFRGEETHNESRTYKHSSFPDEKDFDGDVDDEAYSEAYYQAERHYVITHDSWVAGADMAWSYVGTPGE